MDSQNHTPVERLGLDGTLKTIYFQPLTVHLVSSLLSFKERLRTLGCLAWTEADAVAVKQLAQLSSAPAEPGTARQLAVKCTPLLHRAAHRALLCSAHGLTVDSLCQINVHRCPEEVEVWCLVDLVCCYGSFIHTGKVLRCICIRYFQLHTA